MNNQLSSSNQVEQVEQYFQLWVYLLPVIGVIPAVWTLYQAQNRMEDRHAQNDPALRQQYKASRLSVNLMLAWLSSYALFSLGAANVSGIMSLRLLYANAVTTTGYFLCCTFLLWQLGRKKLFSTKD
ncbi:MAG: hypothetical protein AAGE84_15185 [Cyanobacteria bacterium P01_G01_bin.39]